MGMLLCSALVLLCLVPTQKLERHREPGGVGALCTRSMPWPPSHSESLQGTGSSSWALDSQTSLPVALPWWLCSSHSGLLAPSNIPGSLQLGHLRLRPPRRLMTLPFTSFGFLRSITCRHNLPCSCSLKTANALRFPEKPTCLLCFIFPVALNHHKANSTFHVFILFMVCFPPPAWQLHEGTGYHLFCSPLCLQNLEQHLVQIVVERIDEVNE